jgi:hypothetical protein
MQAEKDAAMHIVVVDAMGGVLARGHLGRDRLSEWLRPNGPGAARCEVLTEAPEKGGTRIAVLRRHDGQRWLSGLRGGSLQGR